MINLVEIENTIKELEEGQTTFANCQKLANLYIVKQYFKSNIPVKHNEVVKEYNDILPMYSNYCDVKRKYQRKELTKDALIESVQNVSREIKEFIKILYANVETPEEKNVLTTMIAELKTLY